MRWGGSMEKRDEREKGLTSFSSWVLRVLSFSTSASTSSLDFLSVLNWRTLSPYMAWRGMRDPQGGSEKRNTREEQDPPEPSPARSIRQRKTSRSPRKRHTILSVSQFTLHEGNIPRKKVVLVVQEQTESFAIRLMHFSVPAGKLDKPEREGK